MKLNFNTLLILLGGLGVFAPDIAGLATWLASMHVAWLGYVVRALGLLAAFCAAAPLVVPRLRAFLALLGLATPPGAQAPWVPGKPGDPQLAQPVDLPSTEKPTPIEGNPVARVKDKGAFEARAIVIVALVGLLALLAIVMLTPGKARAESQEFGLGQAVRRPERDRDGGGVQPRHVEVLRRVESGTRLRFDVCARPVVRDRPGRLPVVLRRRWRA